LFYKFVVMNCNPSSFNRLRKCSTLSNFGNILVFFFASMNKFSQTTTFINRGRLAKFPIIEFGRTTLRNRLSDWIISLTACNFLWMTNSSQQDCEQQLLGCSKSKHCLQGALLVITFSLAVIVLVTLATLLSQDPPFLLLINGTCHSDVCSSTIVAVWTTVDIVNIICYALLGIICLTCNQCCLWQAVSISTVVPSCLRAVSYLGCTYHCAWTAVYSRWRPHGSGARRCLPSVLHHDRVRFGPYRSKWSFI